MSRRPAIDLTGKPSVIIAVRFASDIIEMLDLMTHNRSKFVRDATWEKIDREMNQHEKISG